MTTRIKMMHHEAINEQLSALVSMGFDEDRAKEALARTDGTFDDAVEQLESEGSWAETTGAKLQAKRMYTPSPLSRADSEPLHDEDATADMDGGQLSTLLVSMGCHIEDTRAVRSSLNRDGDVNGAIDEPENVNERASTIQEEEIALRMSVKETPGAFAVDGIDGEQTEEDDGDDAFTTPATESQPVSAVLVDTETENRKIEERIAKEAERMLECERKKAVVGEPMRNPHCSRRAQSLFGVCALLAILAVILGSLLRPSTPVHTPFPTQFPATPSPPVFCGFTILEEQDLLGGDITSPIPLDMAFDKAVEECKDICAALPSCDSFTLVGRSSHPVFNNAVPWCFVKDSVPAASVGNDMTSGIKSSTAVSCTSPDASYTVLASTGLFGFDHFLPCIPLGFAESLETTFDVCKDICSAMSPCKAFTAVDPDIGPLFSVFACCIKNGVPSYDPGVEPNAYSAIKN